VATTGMQIRMPRPAEWFKLTDALSPVVVLGTGRWGKREHTAASDAAKKPPGLLDSCLPTGSRQPK